jgi:hypothetical protein
MMEAIRYSGTSVLTKDTRCYIPDDDILHSHRYGQGGAANHIPDQKTLFNLSVKYSL